MKKIIILLSLFLCISISANIFYYYQQKQNILSSKQCADKPSYSIALFAPAVHAAMNDIEQGFMQTLQQSKQANYLFDHFNAQGNPTLLRAQAEEILDHNYDAIFTIGAGCSKIIKELANKKNITVPHVFTAVDDPVGLNLVQNLSSSGNHLTGIIEDIPYQEQLELLRIIKPTAKSLLLIYNPKEGSGLEKNKQTIENICKTNNIQFHAVEIYQTSDIQQKVPTFLSQFDVIMILKDHTACAGIDVLIKLCKQYQVTLYASDLSSGDKGAALAYGVHEGDFGVEAAKKAQLILEQKILPKNIPSTPIEHHRIKINTKTMVDQNLIIDQKLLHLLSAVEVI